MNQPASGQLPGNPAFFGSGPEFAARGTGSALEGRRRSDSSFILPPSSFRKRCAMIASPEMQEYLDQIRQEVCSRCVERPAGGPPCLPLGKPCGVELHLPQLVESVREVHSDLIGPYLATNRRQVCEQCPYLHHADYCPCPMDSLAVLVVEAIEA